MQFIIHLVIFASGWNVAPFQTKWEISFAPLFSGLWIFGRVAVFYHKDAAPTSLSPAVNSNELEDLELLILK